MPYTRRTFIGTAAGASAAVLIGNTAETNANLGKIRPNTQKGKLLRIGVVTCHPTRHHIPNVWGQLINCIPFDDGLIPTRMTGMLLTHMWDNDPKRVETFCAKFGTEPVKGYNDMIDKVDGVIISDMRAADYFPELSEPYFKAGIPVLFNRPFTTSVGRTKRIVEMSKKYGTPFMVVSGWENCKEVYAMIRKVDEWGPAIKGITAYNVATEISHDVHGVWLIFAMVGVGVESVSMSRTIKSIYKDGIDTWTIKFKPRENSPSFYATLLNTVDRDSNAWVKVILEKGTFEQNLWQLGGSVEQRYAHYFLQPLLEYQRMIERGNMPQSHEHILEKTATYLAGFKSHLERNGQEVKLSDLEDDFTVQSDEFPLTYPTGFFR